MMSVAAATMSLQCRLPEKSQRRDRTGQSGRVTPQNRRRIAVAHGGAEALDQLAQLLPDADGDLHEAHLTEPAKMAALFAELRRPRPGGARRGGGAVNAILRR